MKSFVTGLLLLLAFGWSNAQSVYVLSDSEIAIDGTSTLHDWTSTVTKAGIQGKVTVAAQQLTALQDVKVAIQVKDIKSTKGSIMDNKTWDALKADKHPKISFQSTEAATIRHSVGKTNVSIKGQLTIAGTTQSTNLEVTAKVLPDGRIQFEGTKPIDMTAFGMTPPTALMGSIKTGKAVVVRFQATLSPGNEISTTRK
jgi:polyisoprenoid-binding protein YceI